jgi:hypothetical protein
MSFNAKKMHCHQNSTKKQTGEENKLQIRLLSANDLISDEVAVSGLSLMYARNSRGPRIVAWGTPESTETCLETVSSSITLYLLFSKNKRIHLLVLGLTP